MSVRPEVLEHAKQILTAREYEVFELRENRNYSLRQIAHQLDLALSTVRSTLERSDRKLRRAAA
jgi:RNA polymerase sigma factor (sigma-70 family)